MDNEQPAANSEFKVFVGGISWQLDDKALKRSMWHMPACKQPAFMCIMLGAAAGFLHLTWPVA